MNATGAKLISFVAIFICSLILSSDRTSFAANPHTTLFYMTDSQSSYNSFQRNLGRISIVAPQWFNITESGVVWGDVDSRVIRLAKRHNVKVIPLLINPGFDSKLVHSFLSNSAAQKRAIASMLAIAEKHDFYGWQIDFEHIAVDHRDALTSFYERAAAALHEQGLQVSIALRPPYSQHHHPSAYHRYLYEYWRGAFDLRALTRVSDCVTIMTYSRHNRRTPPGPIAGLPWVTSIVERMVESVDHPNKLLLGIPLWSGHWYADYSGDNDGLPNWRALAHRSSMGLAKRNGATLTWKPKLGDHSAVWSKQGVFEYIYFEDRRSFKAKTDLLERYDLGGIAAWRLGLEDPSIWELLE